MPCVVDFLQRSSSTIATLRLDAPATINLSVEKSPVNFPALTSFRGNVALIPYLKPLSLRSVDFTSFHNLELDEDSILNAMGYFHADNMVESVMLLTRGFTGPFSSAVACHLPSITTLTLIHVSLEMMDYSTETRFENLRGLLPSFQQLNHLCICFSDVLPVASLDETCRMVTVFGSICPKLRTIAYGQDIWTNIPLSFRSENGRIWLPNLCGFSREIEDPKITQWLLDMMCANHTFQWIQFLQDAYLRPRLLPVSVSHELVRSRAERMLCEIDRRMGLEDGEAQSLT